MSSAAGKSEASRSHLGALTGIRGIAAWFVVFYHVRLSLDMLLPPELIQVASKGYLAVDLFFVLSGFVLWFNYGERLRSGGLEDRARFMWRRMARIWPLHAFILCIFIAFAGVSAFTGRSTESYPLAELPMHFLLVHNWGFTSELTWNDPSWSISTEFAAYLVFPFIAVAARWDRMPSLGLLAIALGFCSFVAVLYASQDAYSLGERISQLGIWRCLAQFCLGIIACLLWLRWRENRHACLLAAIAAAVILVFGTSLKLPETVIVPALFFAAILALALDRGIVSRALNFKPVHYLGEISYSTYLAHYGLFIMYKILFVDESLRVGWIGLGGYLGLLLLVSVSLYHGVEKPAQRWLNRHPPKFRTAIPAE